jgi:hypothetical protein
MELSDVTQHQRRVRALLSVEDVRLAVARYVATEAGVHLTDPTTKVEEMRLPIAACTPGTAPVEVILVIDKGFRELPAGQAWAPQDEREALRGL